MTIAAIVGPGYIGTDLLIKLVRNDFEVRYMIGVDPNSDGLKRAEALGVEASAGGVEWLLNQSVLPDLVFEATSAAAHKANAPVYAAASMTAIDLTPAAIGPLLCPVVNSQANMNVANVNMITCGGQATIPIVYAVSRVVPVAYAEIVASISSQSAGPGTRANIDEFTETTSYAIEAVGQAARGKAIIILNPVVPPMFMRDTVFCALPPDTDQNAVAESIHEMVVDVQRYVPGYRLARDPQFDDPSTRWHGHGRVSVFLEVRGNGDHLPPWAGNLDIMTAAAVEVGRQFRQFHINQAGTEVTAK
jgi:acetaldehyde dehydrogenase